MTSERTTRADDQPHPLVCLMGMNHLLNNDDPPVGSPASGSASSSPTNSHSSDGHNSDRSSPDRTIKHETRPVDEEQAARTAASEGIGRLASMGSHLMLQVRTTSSPTHLAATGMTTPRLPPISMLTAAASTLQPRTRRVAVAPPSSMASGSASSSLPPHVQEQQEMLCRYRNKKCTNPRATKRNGDRHNLCERHRAKANQNQRKLESKRRTQKHTAARRQQQQQQHGEDGGGHSVKTDASAPLNPGKNRAHVDYCVMVRS